MRIDSMLNITPEGSQNEYNIMTTLRGDVDQTESQQTSKTSEQRVADNNPSVTALDWAAETPYTPIKVIPRRTSDDQPLRTSRLFNEPRRVQRAREESQEEVLESVRHFFAPVNYNGAIGSGQEQAVQIRSSNGAPTTTVGTTIETHATTTTPAVITTSTTLGTTATNARTGDSSPFPPNGTTFRPTATATCRPQMWVQRISEGGQVCLPLKMLIQVVVVFMHPIPHLRKKYQKTWVMNGGFYIPSISLE